MQSSLFRGSLYFPECGDKGRASPLNRPWFFRPTLEPRGSFEGGRTSGSTRTHS